MDVVAYDTVEPVVVFAASDADRRSATTMTGDGVELCCVDGVEDALAMIDDSGRRTERPDGPVDCVVTTDELSDGTGIELAAAVRERDDDLPVIYVPASGSVEDAEAATAAGATVYLPRGRAASGELAERLDDVVESYDRRRQLTREREMFAALMESAPLPLYAKDAEARHVAVSSYVATGHEQSPLGTTDVDLYGDGDAKAFESYRDDRSVIETGEPILEKVARGESAVGEKGWYSTTKQPWRTPDGEIQGLVGVTRPVTAMKERERELERQRWRLEQFAEFTSTELREPVTTALDALDRARAADGSLVTDADASLAEIDDALDRMQSLIETLLTMARPQSEPAELGWIDLEVAGEQSWGAIEGAAATLECDVDEAIEIQADPDQLHRLLEHLFRAVLDRESAAADSVHLGLSETGFFVEYDGPPLDLDPAPDTDPNEFEYQGAGHRMAIARDIAEAHGWSIEATREPDDCLRFVVDDCLFRPVALASATEGAPMDIGQAADVGDAAPPGEATREDGQWTVRGGGRNVWQDVREFHGVWTDVAGDVRVEAQVTDLEPVHERCKAGVVLFDPADGGVLSSIGLTGTVETESTGRPGDGEPITLSPIPGWEGTGLYYRIDRVGDRTISSASRDGEDWTVVDHRRFHGPERVAAGLLVCSHSTERLATATFDDVRVVQLEVSE
ncbi:PAS domain-containing protein [Salinarchaeum laminariae]|uniref:PAS domain-containing protein n=1 Tax=Salinarchaeum laminariae TaxID=869888 RepID=UPI0020BD83DF|nr:PAS domain-containing protein [Salinarchaeum laminariae]